MFTLKSLIAVAAMAVLSSAAPANSPDAASALTARQVGGTSYASVLACEHPEFTGACIVFGATDNACINVPAGWDNRFSSIKNQNTEYFSCTWHEHYDCQGGAYTNQNDAKLQDGSGFWDDRICSIRCNRKSTNPGGGCGAPFC